jgi:hypothetical protein
MAIPPYILHLNTVRELLFHWPVDGPIGRQPWIDSIARLQKRLKAVMAANGRSEFKCLDCDLLDPLQTDAVKWAKSPLAAPVID